MDPSLQEGTCVCPDFECQDGMAFWDNDDGMAFWEECPRCEGTGYVLCDELRPGERTYTMAQQRAGVWVVVEGVDDDERGN